jgi:hypothetical protein
MPGKYAKYRGKLEAFAQAPDFQAKVDKDKRLYARLDTAKLAKEFVGWKRKKSAGEARERAINVKLEALSQLLVEKLEGADFEAVQLRGGVSVSLQDKPYPSVVDRKKLFGWIKKTRMASLLSVHHQTLVGLVTEALAAGTNPPPGVEVYLKTSAKATGLAKNGEED